VANSVTVPGGSSTVSVPSAPASASSWTERYSVDFSTAVPLGHNFSTGSVPIGGVTWDVDDYGNSSMTEITAGAGLQIATDGTHDTQLLVAPRTPPRVWASVSGAGGLYPSMGSSQSFAIQAIIEPTVELVGDHDEWGMFLSTASLDTRFAASLREYVTASGGVVPYLFRLLDSGAPATHALVAGTAEVSPHTFFEVAYLKGGGCVVSSSADSDFVDPLTATTFQEFVSPLSRSQPGTSLPGSVDFNVTDMRFQIYLSNNNISANAFKLTCTKVRLLTLGS
jgi:hypothetical protein